VGLARVLRASQDTDAVVVGDHVAARHRRRPRPVKPRLALMKHHQCPNCGRHVEWSRLAFTWTWTRWR
jgi:hypothetical protein